MCIKSIYDCMHTKVFACLAPDHPQHCKPLILLAKTYCALCYKNPEFLAHRNHYDTEKLIAEPYQVYD